MRSLWAGVTGLQAHQIAMDVESNNIANVNTSGFKYSRANFSNLLNQTVSIATAPQGELGGKNATQIGLGTQVSSVTKIFKQGSIETTDKTTDLAISGDGFYVVSPDGGTTYKYTRSGDFAFDANGNFVDANGYIVQGWLKNETTGQIDTTSPISNITIPPGLTTPANATSVVTVKANLDSGIDVGKNKTTIYALDSHSGWVDLNNDGIENAGETHDENDTANTLFNSDTQINERGIDFGVLFNSDGKALNLTDGQGAWISYAKAQSQKMQVLADTTTNITKLTMTINGTKISTGDISTPTTSYATTAEKNAAVAQAIETAINAQTKLTGVTATVSAGNYITLSNENGTGTTESTKNIKATIDTTATSSSLTNRLTNNAPLEDINVITAYRYTYSKTTGSTNHTYSDAQERTFTSTEDLREAMQYDARLRVDYTGDGTPDANDGVAITVNSAGQYVISNPKGDAFNSDDGDYTTLTSTPRSSASLTAALAKGDVLFTTGTSFGEPIYPSSNVIIGGTTYNATTPIPIALSPLAADVTIPKGSIIGTATTGAAAATLNTALTTGDVVILAGTTIGANITLASSFNGSITTSTGTYYAGQTIPGGGTMTSTSIIPQGSSATVSGALTSDYIIPSTTTTSTLAKGTNFLSEDDHDLYLTITSMTDGTNISANDKFVSTLSSIGGTLQSGTATRTSQGIYTASLASSTDIYDSLGSKHTIRFQYTKTGFTATGGTEWSVAISVAEPGDINLGQSPKNVVTGSIQFNSDGSLSTYTPRNLTFTANNGSTANQNVQLNFGTVGQLDGVTSFDKTSSVSGISQDGYAGGDLNGISVDETGTIIGSFTNGRSFGLAQVSMATFTNNGGLESDGGNCFTQTSNSGDPIIGQASTGGKGSIKSSSLEMSNVDLSRSLTQLIVIQRGYQANSKTITTSDEMLNTLLQLK